MSARRIWLCADDYGISPAVDSAIRELVARGRINAASVMVATPTFDAGEAGSLAAHNSAAQRVAIGLHVTLTGPFKPLTADYLPQRGGAFLPLTEIMRAAIARKLRTEPLAREIAAQLRTFAAAFGRPPAFVDGHQHVQLFPVIRDALLRVVAEHAPNAWVRQCGRAGWSGRLSNRKGLVLDILSLTFRRRAQRLGLRTNPAFAGSYEFGRGADFARLFPRFLDGLPDGGLVMCHPGFVDAELERLDSLTAEREREFAYFNGEEFPRVLSERGVTLA